MADPTSLEICLDSVASCIAAERGGARRVELCADLAVGGTTPSAGMIAVARNSVRIGIHVMIRPRGGDFCYSDAEFEVMKKDVVLAKELGADGVVFGILTRNGLVEEHRTRELVALARPMEVTFHRAIDATADPLRSLESLIGAGVDRILTSGRAPSALEGIDGIRQLVQQGAGRIAIMAGVGINVGNAREIRDRTGVRDIHVGSGANAPLPPSPTGEPFGGRGGAIADADRVAHIVETLR